MQIIAKNQPQSRNEISLAQRRATFIPGLGTYEHDDDLLADAMRRTTGDLLAELFELLDENDLIQRGERSKYRSLKKVQRAAMVAYFATCFRDGKREFEEIMNKRAAQRIVLQDATVEELSLALQYGSDKATRAQLMDALHELAKHELKEAEYQNPSYLMTRTGCQDTAIDWLSTNTLGEWLRRDLSKPVIPWVRAIVMDELHGRAIRQLRNEHGWSCCDCHDQMYRTEDLTNRDGVLQCYRADDDNPLPVAWRQAVLR